MSKCFAIKFDSHGRRLCDKWNLLIKPVVKTQSVVLPGNTFECVIFEEGSNLSGLKLTKQDYVIILAGTNNIPDHRNGLRVCLGRALEGLVDAKVTVLGLSMRFDAPNLNYDISGVYRGLLATVGNHDHAGFVSSSVSQGVSSRCIGVILMGSENEEF
ncbi:hypothetical protein J6590_021291 [Homalodisca vitripennis]|nr:hypothetical protein J6590_021291 [Homalodisca vitripennis]